MSTCPALVFTDPDWRSFSHSELGQRIYGGVRWIILTTADSDPNAGEHDLACCAFYKVYLHEKGLPPGTYIERVDGKWRARAKQPGSSQ